MKAFTIALGAAASILGASFVAAPLHAEVVEETATGFTTRDAAVVKGTPYEVWLALIAPAKWWNKSHTWSGDAANLYISPQANGCFCELLPPPADAPDEIRRGSALHMTVIQADPGKALRMRGGLGPLQSEPADGVLTVALSKEGEGTRIVWEYVVGGPMRYKVPEISKAVDGVMTQQLRGLARLLGPVEAAAPADAAAAAPEASSKAAPAEKAAASTAVKPKPGPAPAKPNVEQAFEDIDGAQ